MPWPVILDGKGMEISASTETFWEQNPWYQILARHGLRIPGLATLIRIPAGGCRNGHSTGHDPHAVVSRISGIFWYFRFLCSGSFLL